MREALAAWGLAEAVVEPLAGGAPHQHWSVAGADGYVLRRYAARHSDDAVRYEHELLAYLDEHSWPVAAPVVAADGATLVHAEGARWALFPVHPGSPPPDEPIYLQRRGALLALLHEDLAESPVTPSREGPVRLDDLDGVARVAGAPSLNALHEAVRDVDAGRADALAALHERSLAALERYGYARFPTVAIWGGCTAEHVLFEGDDVTALLDFDDAREDARVVDVAASLLADARGDGWRVHRWIAGYCAHAVPPFHAIEANLVPVAMTALALRSAVATIAEAHAAGCLDAATLACLDDVAAAEAAEADLRRVIRTAAGHPSVSRA